MDEKIKFGKEFEFTMGPNILQKVKRKSSEKYSEQKLEKECADCLELKTLLSDQKKVLFQQEKKTKVLIVQKTELQKEISKWKSLYDGIKKNIENLDYKEIIQKKDNEIKDLSVELKRTQDLFLEISNEYDSFTMSVSRIENINENEDYERAIKEKEIQLEKAQALIKKLNEECEDLGQQLFDTQNSKERVQNSESEGLKTKVTGLQQELRKSKRKHKDFKANKWEEIENYKKDLESLLSEKTQLESALEELNNKFKEIENMSTHRLGEFCKTYEKIQNLEGLVLEKDLELAKQKNFFENLETTRQIELNNIKKSAELAFHNLKQKNQAKTSDDNEGPIEKTSPSIKNMKLIIKELIIQDSNLRKDIYKLITTEAKVIKRVLNEMHLKVENFHSDFEKWVMRNEELEQRILEVQEKNINLVKVIQDLQKIILAKDKQFDDVVGLYTSIGSEMQATIEFMSVEIVNKQNFVIKDVLPSSHKYFTKALSDAHIQIFRRLQRSN